MRPIIGKYHKENDNITSEFSCVGRFNLSKSANKIQKMEEYHHDEVAWNSKKG